MRPPPLVDKLNKLEQEYNLFRYTKRPCPKHLEKPTFTEIRLGLTLLLGFKIILTGDLLLAPRRYPEGVNFKL